ncbi:MULTISPECIES: hypothetical protein [Actinomadura]|uniref:Uncharacterized protein n=1 Tax=Actinomadura yumaensis TaxID=111807 RepID=A0ABW2C9H3_9ACTN|nr:hypothetical protein [Actinomadura sp. J1-007]MWK33850.1 hypothetical protein [Actinomadura sp. J1-007]
MGDARGEIRIVGAEGSDGLELRTQGLEALGLPELRVTGLPPYLGQGWARVLAAIAGRLAADPAERPDLVLPPDVAVHLVENGDGTLTPVRPPSEDGHGDGDGHEDGRGNGDEGDWRRDVLLRLFPAARS